MLTTPTYVGLAEYLCFLLCVVGLLLLRRREARDGGPPASHYRTWIGHPVIFTVVSSLLILRGVVNEPLQGAAIAVLALLGLGVFWLKFGLRGFSKPADLDT